MLYVTYDEYGRKEIVEGPLSGSEDGEILRVWRLESGNSGNDMLFIGSKEEALNDLLSYHNLDEMPEGWELEEVESRSELSERLVEQYEDIIGIKR